MKPLKIGDKIQYERHFHAEITEVGEGCCRAKITKLLEKGWFGFKEGHELWTAYPAEIARGICWKIAEPYKDSKEEIVAKNGQKITCGIRKK